MHLQKEEFTVEGKKYTKESLLFPRYHQLDAVRNLPPTQKSAAPAGII